MSPVLQVRDLHVAFDTPQGVAHAVDQVSFSLEPGQIMGLVGESGCGKSTVAYALLGLTTPPGRVVSGEVLLTPRGGHTRDLLRLSAKELQQVRGNRVALIFQDPLLTLNPVLRIDTQMVETIRAHQQVSHAHARARALDTLVKVGIASPEERLRAYPHELSGGMRQRVVIAIALLNQPDVIIADEPTTALDVTTQAQILAQVQALCRDTGTALVWITHDMSVVARLADQVAVMYAGRIVEQGPVVQVLTQPRHPYTLGLMASDPSRTPRGQALQAIAGSAPPLLNLPAGCAFAPRCPHVDEACSQRPPPRPVDGRELRCAHPVGLPPSSEAL